MTIPIALFRTGMTLAVCVVQLSRYANRFHPRALRAIAADVAGAARELEQIADIIERARGEAEPELDSYAVAYGPGRRQDA